MEGGLEIDVGCALPWCMAAKWHRALAATSTAPQSGPALTIWMDIPLHRPPVRLQPASPPSAAATATSAAAASSNADLGGALRVLMQHRRLADAAALAAQHLQAALASVPSVSMARMSQVRFL